MYAGWYLIALGGVHGANVQGPLIFMIFNFKPVSPIDFHVYSSCVSPQLSCSERRQICKLFNETNTYFFSKSNIFLTRYGPLNDSKYHS